MAVTKITIHNGGSVRVLSGLTLARFAQRNDVAWP
jgi:hypothetical protein